MNRGFLTGCALATLTLAACTVATSGTPHGPGSATAILRVRPDLTAGTSRVQAIRSRADVDHIVVKLFQLESGESGESETPVVDAGGMPMALDLPVASHSETLEFADLGPNRTYRVRGYAYGAPGTLTQDLVSVEAASFVDVAIGSDDRPEMATLPIRLQGEVFSATGSLSLAIPTSQLGHIGSESLAVVPQAVALTTSMHFYGLWHQANGNLAASIADGNTLALFDSEASTYSAVTGFASIQAIAPDASGNLFVFHVSNLAGAAMTKVAPDGTRSNLFSQSSIRLSSMAVSGDGTIYAANSLEHQIVKISPDGQIVTFAGTASAGHQDGPVQTALFSAPGALTFDSTGRLLIAEYGGNRIRAISPDGIVTTLAGSGIAGRDDGQGIAASFDAPTGIYADSRDNLYVWEFGKVNIRKISPDGFVRTLPMPFPGVSYFAFAMAPDGTFHVVTVVQPYYGGPNTLWAYRPG